MSMHNLLLVDDDAAFGPNLAKLIEREGFRVDLARNLAEARAYLQDGWPAGVLVDLKLPDGCGLELLEESGGTDTQMIVITGNPSVDSAILGVRDRRIRDYLVKPVDTASLRAWLRKLSEATRPHEDADGLIGASQAMRELKQVLRKVAPSEATVLLHGESGTGKEVAASRIHALSARREGPFLALNCGAVPEALIANELFGHERGGYTGAAGQHKGYFERAQGGTLFLDEITEMPSELQVSLLRVLETGKLTRLGGTREVSTDVRLLAATNRDPLAAVEEGKLRADLYYRLAVFPVHIPPLRERAGDIELLAEHFVAERNRTYETAKTLSAEAKKRLGRHAWPGNVRELHHAVQRAYIMADGDIDADDCAFLAAEEGPKTRSGARRTDGRLGRSLNDAEQQLIAATLEEVDGNKRQAAERLGISVKTLYNKLRRHGLA